MANADQISMQPTDDPENPYVSPSILVIVFGAQIILISSYLLWSRSDDLPLLINAKRGDTTVRLLMLLISLSSLVYCIYFYVSVFRKNSYPNLTAISKFMPFVPVLSLLIMIIFVACVVSKTYTLEKLVNSIYAIFTISRWAEYTSVDPWPSLTIVMFGLTLSTCLCISNITISILYVDESNSDRLKDYIFYLHFCVAIIALLYGLTLFATNTAFFEKAPTFLSSSSSTVYGIDIFIINYSIIVLVYFLLVFLIPALRYKTLDSGRSLIARLGSLTMPAWLLPIHAYLVSNVPIYEQVMKGLGLVFPK
ncbi:hypothetical protein [Bosea sp. (in: a-proteobacteria)]|uniref:hypothetical protein n=1 Tax=Bosea sp. (in: a-proteobacteria) TaxID=1871050 RepID=UPI002FC7FF67